MSLRERLVELIARRAHLAPAEVQDDTPLISSGLLDSLVVVDLVRELERSAGVAVPPADVSAEHLDTLARILAYVERARR